MSAAEMPERVWLPQLLPAAANGCDGFMACRGLYVAGRKGSTQPGEGGTAGQPPASAGRRFNVRTRAPRHGAKAGADVPEEAAGEHGIEIGHHRRGEQG